MQRPWPACNGRRSARPRGTSLELTVRGALTVWPLAALVESRRSQYVDRLADFPNGVFDERASGWYRRFDPSYYDRRANVQERGNKHPQPGHAMVSALVDSEGAAGGKFTGWSVRDSLPFLQCFSL
jgi:hypothetical protein